MDNNMDEKATSSAASDKQEIWEQNLRFISRRSPYLCKNAMVASSQPLASEIGMRILKQGGNAADASVAMSAALGLLEPASTGIGGDFFLLYYDATTQEVTALNGSGRSPVGLTTERLKEDCPDVKTMPLDHAHAITVPGAAMAWRDTLSKHGKLSFAEVLEPSITLGEEGFPVGPVSAYLWKEGEPHLQRNKAKGFGNSNELLNSEECAPKFGEVFRNPPLSRVYRDIAEKGVEEGFYAGETGDAIVKAIQEAGGVLSSEDLKAHKSTFPDPISVDYAGIEVFQVPPNGQGITGLMALNVLKETKPPKPESQDEAQRSKHHNGVEYLHKLIESLRIAFADTRWYVADPEVANVPMKEMLSAEYAKKRAEQFDPSKASLDVQKGSPFVGSDTVSFQVVDQYGNAASVIQSVYHSMGSGLVPDNCGFVLQNRGGNFSLDPACPNCLEPNKRPYHTIIPGMCCKDGDFWATYTVMGGFNQPQGHVQVLLNMIDHHMDPQLALDQPRFCIENGEAGGEVSIEEGVAVDVVAKLKAMGHPIKVVSGYDRKVCGRGQIIRKVGDVLWGGSDGRGDGCAMGW